MSMLLIKIQLKSDIEKSVRVPYASDNECCETVNVMNYKFYPQKVIIT